jgi:WD40 repeat protein/predicted Ser/Thr protein kinase
MDSLPNIQPGGARPDTRCPPAEAIDALAAGESLGASVAAHVARCRACADAVEAARFVRRFASVMEDETSDVPRLPGLGAHGGRAAGGDEGAMPEAVGYRFLAELARGGQGVVYRAEQVTTGQVVAIKVLHRNPVSGAGWTLARARFLREIQIAASLNHPGIVRLLDSLTLSDGRDALIMELIEGVPLDVWVQRRPGLGEAARLNLLAEIADALAHAHQRGIIHRDLKPSNIVVDGSGRARVLDFGVARRHGPEGASDRLTRTGEFTGTLAYAAPEQVLDDASTPDVRTDIYALGVIGFRVLAGRLPYGVDGSLESAVRNILHAPMPTRSSVGLATDPWTVLAKAMAKEPGRRYQSASAMAGDLRRAASGGAIAARGDSGWYTVRKAARRYRVTLALAFSVLVGMVGVLIALAVGNARLGEALRESRLQQVRAHTAGDARERAAAILWEEIGRGLPAGTDPEVALWAAPIAQRELLWAFVEMQARATCVAEIAGAAGSCVSIDSVQDGRFGMVTADKRVLWMSLDGDEPVLTEGPALAPGTVRGWFSPSGSRLVTSEGDGVRCVDARTGASLGWMDRPEGAVWRIRVSEWGMAVCSAEGELIVAALPGMEVLHRVGGLHTEQLPWLDASARSVTYLDARGTLVTTDLDTGASSELAGGPVADPDAPVMHPQVLVTPDRRTVVVAHSGGVLVAGTGSAGADDAGTPGGRVLLRPGYRVGASLSPDGSLLAAQAFGDSTLRLWTTGTRAELLGLPGHHGTVVFHAFSADGHRIVTTDRAGVLRVWAAPARGWRRAMGGATARTHRLAVAGGTLVASDARGRLVMLRPNGSSSTVIANDGPLAGVMAAVSEHAGLLVSANLDDRITLSTWPPGGRTRTVSVGAGDTVSGLAFAPENTGDGAGGVLGVCTSDGRVVLVEPGRSAITAEVSPAGGGASASDLCWSPDGSWLAASFRDGRVAVLEAGTLRTRHVVRVSQTQVRSIASAPDGRTLAAVGDSGELILIDVATGRVRSTAQVSENSLFAVAFHPLGGVGGTLAVGDRAGRVTVIDASTLRPLASVKADGAVMTLAFDPSDGALFVSALDAPVERWDFTMLAATMRGLRASR